MELDQVKMAIKEKHKVLKTMFSWIKIKLM